MGGDDLNDGAIILNTAEDRVLFSLSVYDFIYLSTLSVESCLVQKKQKK